MLSTSIKTYHQSNHTHIKSLTAWIVSCHEGTKEPDVETSSKSTVGEADDLPSMTARQLSSTLFCHLLDKRPITTSVNTSSMDEVRAIISAEFGAADDGWKITAPKVVQSRYRHIDK